MTQTHSAVPGDDAQPDTPDFHSLGLGPELLKALSEAGYSHPTPIQAQAIPFVLMGRDVLGCAQTGTGKTAGFTLPMIEILAAGRAKARMPRSLILCPTRELAAQVADNFDKYGKYHRLNKALIIGGESMGDQMALLDRGVDVLIATPGRLLDMFERGRILLTDVKVLVIDEADRMLDMGFIPDVQRIVSILPKIRQTLFFSATLGPEIRKLADDFLMNPKEITIDPESTTAATVEQFLVVVDEDAKREALRRIIKTEDVKNAFIFCNRKRDVGILFKSLSSHGFDVVQLHGDMTQPARMEALGKFKSGDARLMVCSDVAARGIDIKGVSHVFNFDVPLHAEDYVHRIGRTGRAGMSGRAYTIAAPQDGILVASVEKLTATPIPRIGVEGFDTLELEFDAKRRRRTTKGKTDARPERDVRKPAERNRAPDTKPDAPAPAQNAEAPQPRREQPQRSESGRSEGGRSEGGRSDRRPRGRGRFDEFGIGEMRHADDVIGFGDHVPEFILSVPFPQGAPPEPPADEFPSDDE